MNIAPSRYPRYFPLEGPALSLPGQRVARYQGKQERDK